MTLILIAFMSFYNMIARVTFSEGADEVILNNINSFKITESVKELSDKATITLAKNIKEFGGDTYILDHLRPGMKVKIECGYNGDLQTEYTGYVKGGIPSEFPLVVECDELWKLRQGNVLGSWRSIALRDFLQLIAPGFQIDCPDTMLGKMTFSNWSPYQVLNEITKKYGFYFRIQDDTLSAGWAYDYKPSFTKNHLYRIGWNVKDAKNLKFVNENDLHVRVKSTITILGKKIPLTYGSKEPGAKEVKVDHFPPNVNQSVANNILKSEYSKMVYTGFQGSFVGFGVPRCNAGDSVTLEDPNQPERNGTYLVEKVEKDYDDPRINRTIHLSYKIA